MSDMVLALYDFASKQEYIYRTSKIKEISGASALLEKAYGLFRELLEQKSITLRYEPNGVFSLEAFHENAWDGEVLYEGGGNLMVLWRTEETYKNANEIISVDLLQNVPGLFMIASCVKYTGRFEDDRAALYEKNSERKNRFPAYQDSAVLPITQVDPATFLPVTYKRDRNAPGSVYPAAQCSLSSDRYAKAACFEAVDRFDEQNEGMLAVIYVDGNAMGDKLKKCASQNYDEGVNKLRDFSAQVNRIYVELPLQKIREGRFSFRKVIGGGDEITLICRAEDAFRIMRLYFDVLSEQKLVLDKESACTSCAGISVFHAKAPFSVAYDIAEAACEEAKKRAHEPEKDGNYFCFYYCHAGVTNSFDELHKREQEHASSKPYGTEKLADFDRYASLLRSAGRSNVKALGAAAFAGPAYYRFETARVNAYLPKGSPKFKGDENERRLVYDMSEFYDLWFNKEEKPDEKND